MKLLGCNKRINISLQEIAVDYISILGYESNNLNINDLTKIVFRELKLESYYNYRIMNNNIYFGLISDEAILFLLDKNQYIKPTSSPISDIINAWASTRNSMLADDTNELMVNACKDMCNLHDNLSRRDYIETQISYCLRLEDIIYGKQSHNLSKEIRKQYIIANLADTNVHKFHTKICEELVDRLTPSYLGGLFDGDGSMIIQVLESGYQLNVSFPQSAITILQVLKYKYGGYISKGRWKPNQRQQYTYRICGRASKTLLQDLAEGCILKKAQALNCLEFLELLKKPNLSDIKAKHHLYNKQLNSLAIYPPRIYNVLNLEYVAGLFDAEGCVFIYKPGDNNKKVDQFYLNICQKNHPIVLDEIARFLGYGHKCDYTWVVNAWQDKLKFVMDMIPRTIVKKAQLLSLKALIDDCLSSKPFDNASYQFRSECYRETQREKHESDIVDSQLLRVENNSNKIMIRINKILEHISATVAHQKVRHIKHYNIGEANANYGGLSTEHKIQISISRQHQSEETDQQILQIRELLEKGTTIKDIATTLEISENYVAKVKSGYHVLTTERNAREQAEYNKKEQSQKEAFKETMCSSPEDEILFSTWCSAKAKRIVPLSVFIDILVCCDLLLKKGEVSAKLRYSEIFKICKKDPALKKHNIKQLLSGTTKLYKFDFIGQKMTYDEYLRIIKENVEYGKVKTKEGDPADEALNETMEESVATSSQDSQLVVAADEAEYTKAS